MVIRLVSGASALILGAGLIVGVGAGPASAASTFTVSTSACSGSGSLAEAIADANADADASIITVDPGLTLNAQCFHPPTGDADYYLATVEHDLEIQGGGALLAGNINWVTPGGLVSPLGSGICPSSPQLGNRMTTYTPGFLRVAAGISVKVTDLRLRELNSIARVEAGATLWLDQVQADRILSTQGSCEVPAIVAKAGSNVTLTDNRWDTVVNFGQVTVPGALIPAIEGFPTAGSLTIRGSRLSNVFPGGVVLWDGQAGSTMDIVSSRVDRYGGLVASGQVVTRIVNSAWSMEYSGDPQPAARIINSSAGRMSITASTVMFPDVYCDSTCQFYGAPGWIHAPGTGGIALSQSAIGVNFPADPPGLVLTGSVTADDQTWIQPVTGQDAAALKAATGEPGLLTDAPGLWTGSGAVSGFSEYVSPLLGTPSTPGVLIDAIPDAAPGGANQLLDPVSLALIATDVFGNPRVDGNDRRNIGAVQLTLAPHLVVSSAGDGVVDLAWSRPQDPGSGALTGYAILYRPSGSAGSFSRVDVGGASTTSGQVTGLVNGTEYEFKVVGVNGSGDGPDSNTVRATPFGTPGAPVVSASAGDGTLTAFWTEPASGGHPGPAAYTLALVDTVTGATTVRGPISARTASFPGLVNGHPYQVQVFATWTDGVSGNAGQATATPFGAIGTPVLSARGVAQGIRATWTAPSTGGHTLSGYRVSLRQIGTTRKEALTTTSRSVTVTGLKPGRAYRVCVTARMTDGTRSAAACRTRVAGVRATATLRVRFGEQSPVLTSAQKRRLVAALPRDRGSISSVVAIGYVQRARDNSKALWLSRARARSVTSFLRTRGVAASTRIAGRGIGGTTPAWRAVDVTIRYYR